MAFRYSKFLEKYFPYGTEVDKYLLLEIDKKIKKYYGELHAKEPSRGYDIALDSWNRFILSYLNDLDALRLYIDGVVDIYGAIEQGEFKITKQASSVSNNVKISTEIKEEINPNYNSYERKINRNFEHNEIRRRNIFQILQISLPIIILILFWYGGKCGVFYTGCSESGWLQADNKTNHVISFTHGLGSVPTEIDILFTDRLPPVSVAVVGYNFNPGSTGNPVWVEATSDDVSVYIFKGAPLRGTWSAKTGKWNLFTSGYLKIRAKK
jgi:hypothetical protein